MTVCKRCIMDSTAPDITFNDEGCNYCEEALSHLSTDTDNEQELLTVIENIKKAGKGKRFDCLIGLSGGTDSSYVAYLCWKYGLRPLAIHLDNGYDTSESKANIEHVAKHFNIPLYWVNVNWQEYRDLQIAFLKASTPDCEIPTDHALVATMYGIAAEQGIKYIVGGQNYATESIMPLAWSRGHADWKYIRAIHKKFGQFPLYDFPHYTPWRLAWWLFIKKIRWWYILDYTYYNKAKAKKILADELGWQDYGSKHCESIYTRFYQQFILPYKFGFDKRKAHLSSLIVSGMITREEALQQLAETPDCTSDMKYVLDRLELSESEFMDLMNQPPKTYFDYSNLEKTWYYRVGRMLYRWVRHRK